MRRDIVFSSGGLDCKGWLFLPDDLAPGQKAPAIVMAHARGVILALAARSGLTVLSISATQMKKHLTGSGRAGKAQVQRAIAATLRLPRIPEPDDVADALAVAICHWQETRKK